MRTGQRVLTAAVCFGTIAAPLLFLFAVPGARPGDGVMSGLYASLVVLLEEKLARFIFCAVWLGLDAALVWRLFFSKRGADDGGPIEGLGD
jgi:hypothetical protein